jgi:hypothetical protein
MGLADLFYEPLGTGNAHEKRIDIALRERGKSVENHQVFCLSTRDDARYSGNRVFQAIDPTLVAQKDIPSTASQSFFG